MFGKHITLLTDFIATFYRQNVKCLPFFAKNIETLEKHVIRENEFFNSPILDTLHERVVISSHNEAFLP